MSPPSSSAALRQPEPEPAEYAAEERRLLLGLAHDAILAALEKRELDTTPPTPHLAELRGAFTTLHLGGELRGGVDALPRASAQRLDPLLRERAALEQPARHPVDRILLGPRGQLRHAAPFAIRGKLRLRDAARVHAAAAQEDVALVLEDTTEHTLDVVIAVRGLLTPLCRGSRRQRAEGAGSRGKAYQ